MAKTLPVPVDADEAAGELDAESLALADRIGREAGLGPEEALNVANIAAAVLLRDLEPARAVALALAELAARPANVLPFWRKA